MKVAKNQIFSPSFELKNEAECPDCEALLSWESHGAGSLTSQSWRANCDCNDGQRLWIMHIDSFNIFSKFDKV